MTKRVLQGVVVGAGFMGRTHLAAYASRKDAKIVCVVDRDTQKADGLARPHGCEVRTDLAQALQDWQIDFVDVCLPSTLHRSAVTTALGAKAHVLVEKPFATTLEDVDAMIGAAESADRRLMVAHVCRFMPQYRYRTSPTGSSASPQVTT
jgi:predicted dehydrogenase